MSRFGNLIKRFGLLIAIIVASFGAPVGKGKTVVKKNERGGRDASGNKKKNEKVREANKDQRESPDPNSSTEAK